MSDLKTDEDPSRSDPDLIDNTPESNAQSENDASTSSKLDEDSQNDDNSKDKVALSTHQSTRRRILYKMLAISRDLFCLIMCILSTYAAFQNSGPKISPPPRPRPFFPEGSLVTDWFRGEIGPAILRGLEEHEVSVFMYYAPWNAECQHFRKDFDLVASFYYKQVHFSAINCWQPESHCDLVHGSQLTEWPKIVTHKGNKVVTYRGPLTAAYLIRFIQNLINPLTRVTNTNQLIELVQNHYSVLYATIHTEAEYFSIYHTSLKLLQIDPTRNLGVAVTINSFLPKPATSNKSVIRLITTNGTLLMAHQNWTVNYIMDWTFKNVHWPLEWTTLPGIKKSTLLSGILQPHPGLLLFTPNNPLLQQNVNFEILRAIVLQYYNCNNHKTDIDFLNTVISGIKQEKQQIQNLERKCFEKAKKTPGKFRSVPAKSFMLSIANNSYCDKIDILNTFNTCGQQCRVTKLEQCSNLERNYYEENDEEEDTLKVLHKDSFTDHLSPENLLKQKHNEECRFLAAAKKFNKITFPPDVENIEKIPQLDGLLCKTNLSLLVTAIDSLRFSELANALGVDLLSKPDKTAVIIVDATRESHFVMNTTFSYNNVADFIINFTNGNLYPTFLSRAHGFDAPKSYGTRHEFYNSKELSLVELTSTTFLPTVMKAGKSFVVLFYSTYCDFCTDASRILLTLAKIFAPLKSSLEFARIDGEAHPLPWNFNMPQYPTILFFPARRKSETRVFPQNVIRTVPNLINFVLANLEPPTNLQALWLLCHKTKFADDIRSCMSHMRDETLQVLRATVRQWRKFGKFENASDVLNKNIILRRLKHLRMLHLKLGTVMSVKSQTSTINKLLKRLEKIWIPELR